MDKLEYQHWKGFEKSFRTTIQWVLECPPCSCGPQTWLHIKITASMFQINLASPVRFSGPATWVGVFLLSLVQVILVTPDLTVPESHLTGPQCGDPDRRQSPVLDFPQHLILTTFQIDQTGGLHLLPSSSSVLAEESSFSSLLTHPQSHTGKAEPSWASRALKTTHRSFPTLVTEHLPLLQSLRAGF